MKISDDLLCLFTAQVDSRNGSYVVEIPERELSLGDLEEHEHYRVVVLPSAESAETPSEPQRAPSSQAAPVNQGEHYEVEIEDTGEQGDGIARIGPGYIVFVPDTEIGDRVTVEITEVRERFAFAEVIEEEPIA